MRVPDRDGVLPSNEGRGYVLRRIMRRAIRHGFKLGQREPFFHTLVRDARAARWARPTRSCTAQRAHIERVIRQEEERFAETLAQGMALLDAAIGKPARQAQIPGETVFRLYDTYGFPLDLTNDIARERGLTHRRGRASRRRWMQQRARARAASKFSVDLRADVQRRTADDVRRLRQRARRGTHRRAVPRQGARDRAARR